ncbi:hypothetical protein [Bradyrhizobium sp. LA6.12]|uniref:hypothetical protein n=1 Tax=unclassified Bradyrhizobium TaxID=2631580 RepID=UPI0033959DE3
MSIDLAGEIDAQLRNAAGSWVKPGTLVASMVRLAGSRNRCFPELGRLVLQITPFRYESAIAQCLGRNALPSLPHLLEMKALQAEQSGRPAFHPNDFGCGEGNA